MTNDPRLSVVLVSDSRKTIASVLDAFHNQTARHEIEVVVVVPRGVAREFDESRHPGFAKLKLVEVETVSPMAGARVAGVLATTAPVVFLGETHSYADPGFARAIIDAHDGPWDVVVPGLENANPASPRSWAAFISDYGYWLSALPAAPIGWGPTWNAAYKRHVLTGLGGRLETALSGGDDMGSIMRETGASHYFAPSAKIRHLNLERRGWLSERFLAGRIVGGKRSRRWSRQRRVLYLLASPLIPFVLLYKMRSVVLHLLANRRLSPATALRLGQGLVVRTAGEVTGYVRGTSDADEHQMEEYEIHKEMYVDTIPHARPAPE